PVALHAGCGGAAEDIAGTIDDSASPIAAPPPRAVPNLQPFADPAGAAATYSTRGSVDLQGAFFQSLGTNGRSCGSCHQIADGWSIAPPHIRDRFETSQGLDPLFRPNDGSTSPRADVSTVLPRRPAYALMYDKGRILLGLG